MPPHVGPGDAPKGTSVDLGGGRQYNFYVSYNAGKTLKSVKVCLECPVFNALGAAVCRPQSLARRWAGQHSQRHIAWPWQRCQCKLFVSHRVDKKLKSVSVFLKYVVFIALAVAVYQPPPPPKLPDAGLGDVLKGALPSLGRGANPFFGVVLC